MKIPTLEEINAEIELGHIKKIVSKSHPNLVKYKYTKKCASDKAWNETNKFCRGVIFDNNHNLIALPMLKMFNIGENEDNQETEIVGKYKKYVTTKKYDGVSIIVHYNRNRDEFIFSTLGSFDNEFIDEAKKIFYAENYDHTIQTFFRENTMYTYPENLTFCFELISPISKIVIDYKTEKDLFLFAVNYFNNDENSFTMVEGEDYEYLEDIGFRVPENSETDEFDLQLLKDKVDLKPDDEEGFVVHCFNEGLYYYAKSVKVKYDYYFRRSFLKNYLNEKTIYEMIYKNELDKILKDNAETFTFEDLQFIESIKNDFENERDILLSSVHEIIDKLPLFGEFEDNKNSIPKQIGLSKDINKQTKNIMFSLLKIINESIYRNSKK